MRAHKCYDIIPTSAKLVIFDTQLNVSTPCSACQFALNICCMRRELWGIENIVAWENAFVLYFLWTYELISKGFFKKWFLCNFDVFCDLLRGALLLCTGQSCRYTVNFSRSEHEMWKHVSHFMLFVYICGLASQLFFPSIYMFHAIFRHFFTRICMLFILIFVYTFCPEFTIHFIDQILFGIYCSSSVSLTTYCVRNLLFIHIFCSEYCLLYYRYIYQYLCNHVLYFPVSWYLLWCTESLLFCRNHKVHY